jgi:hypothetical protein
MACVALSARAAIATILLITGRCHAQPRAQMEIWSTDHSFTRGVDAGATRLKSQTAACTTRAPFHHVLSARDRSWASLLFPFPDMPVSVAGRCCFLYSGNFASHFRTPSCRHAVMGDASRFKSNFPMTKPCDENRQYAWMCLVVWE